MVVFISGEGENDGISTMLVMEVILTITGFIFLFFMTISITREEIFRKKRQLNKFSPRHQVRNKMITHLAMSNNLTVL